uniref:Ig-like domain-containing protein n=1 Tax=Chromohalobacter sp. 48-RD10 TaxID=2994063 RepID=UPI0024692B29
MVISAKVAARQEDLSQSSAVTVDNGTLSVSESRHILLSLSPQDVASLSRDGNDLIIQTSAGETLRIEDFYGDADTPSGKLYLTGEDQQLILADLGSAASNGAVSAEYVPLNEYGVFEPAATTAETASSGDGGWGTLGWLAAGGAVAAGAAIASGGSGSGSGNNTDIPTEDNDNSEDSDTQAPDQPENLEVADDGASVTGTAEPGSTVTVSDADGNELGSATAGDDGSFSVPLDPALTNGEEINVVATDPAGNQSDPATATAPDLTAPDAPADVAVNDDGSVVTGTAEPGSRVTVTDENGNTLGSDTADNDGNFNVSIEPPQINGEDLDVVATDDAGNSSDPVSVTAPDNTAPDAPADVAVNDEGSVVTGSAEPGSTVTVTDENGNILGSDTADDDGNFDVSLEPPQINGEDVTATATDDAGNSSDPVSVTAPDNTAPDAPADVAVNDDGSVVTGTAEPGSTVTVSDENGNSLGSDTADNDGNFNVSIEPPQTNGEDISATATDEAGNESDPASATAPDLTAPTPDDNSITIVTGDDALLSADEAESVTLTGQVEDGASIASLAIASANGGDPVVIQGGDITLNDGGFSLDGVDVTGLNDGELTTTLSITDAAGNTGTVTDTATLDTVAPDAPTIDPTNGTELTGTAEAGSTVTIDTNGDGEVDETATADGDGNWSVTPEPVLADDTQVSATATDAAGNKSEPTTQ